VFPPSPIGPDTQILLILLAQTASISLPILFAVDVWAGDPVPDPRGTHIKTHTHAHAHTHTHTHTHTYTHTHSNTRTHTYTHTHTQTHTHTHTHTRTHTHTHTLTDKHVFAGPQLELIYEASRFPSSIFL
jgi:hypothetical protein